MNAPQKTGGEEVGRIGTESGVSFQSLKIESIQMAQPNKLRGSRQLGNSSKERHRFHNYNISGHVKRE